MNRETEGLREVTSLEEATRPRVRASGVFDLDVPDGWQQGRGAYGGLTLAALVRAIEAFAATGDRPLRSLTAALPAATLRGPASIEVEALRVGAGQSTLSARLLQEGGVRAQATAVLAKPRAPHASSFCELEAPRIRPFHEVPAVTVEQAAVRFARHFEFRAEGPLPFSGHSHAIVEGWVRAREVSDPQNAGAMSQGAWLTALADAYWPASFVRMTSFTPIGTVAFTLQVVGGASDEPPLDQTLPLLYRARTWSQSAGWFVEQRELWSAPDPTSAPRLVALNQQTFAII